LSQNQSSRIPRTTSSSAVLKGSGFVAYGVTRHGQLQHGCDCQHVTSAILGRSFGVCMTSATSPANSSTRDYVIAIFLDMPANNCAILQSGNHLKLLPAGQHCITHPNVTLRRLCTIGENQLEMPMKD
ncbi:hypothetical protein EDB85DRAFT_1837301, partial [Lactarius pseudohatsudake]